MAQRLALVACVGHAVLTLHVAGCIAVITVVAGSAKNSDTPSHTPTRPGA